MWAIVVGGKQFITVFDAASGEKLYDQGASNYCINCTALRRGNQTLLFTAESNAVARVIDVEAQKEIAKNNIGTNALHSVAVSPNRQVVAYGNGGGVSKGFGSLLHTRNEVTAATQP